MQQTSKNVNSTNTQEPKRQKEQLMEPLMQCIN